MRPLLALTILAIASHAEGADFTIAVPPSPALPKGGEVALVAPGQPGPTNKGYQPILKSKEVGQALDLADAGPFDIYYTPKGGLPVLAVAKWKVAKGANELKLGSHLGTVYVRGDELPRTAAVCVTATDDPGPGEKGHVAIQTVGDYKEDLVVPDGFYAVWIVPANGAKARKVADKIRVLAGRQTVVPE